MPDKRDVCKCGMATMGTIQNIDVLGDAIEEGNLGGVFQATEKIERSLDEMKEHCQIETKDIRKEVADIREFMGHKDRSRASILYSGLERGIYFKLSECAGD